MKKITVCFAFLLLSGCGSVGAKVTKAEYDQIPVSASYAQVASVVGDPGENSQHQEMMGITTDIYTWQNPDGSNLICMFQNDKLINKTQTQLP